MTKQTEKITLTLTDSPFGNAARKGLTETHGGYQSFSTEVDHSEVERGFFAGFRAARYALRMDYGLVAAYIGDKRVPVSMVASGIVAMQNETNTVALMFSRLENKYGLVANNADMTGEWKEIEMREVPTDAFWDLDLTVTVVRDGACLKVFFGAEQTPVFETDLTAYLKDAGEATAVGVFSVHAVTRFTNAVLTETPEELPAVKVADETPREVDVVLLAGQSNMLGIANVEALIANDPASYEKVRLGFRHTYISYLCDNNKGYRFTPVTLGEGWDGRFFGPEVGLAAYWEEHFPDRELYIIKCAFGATKMYDEWRPSSPAETNRYTRFIEHMNRSIAQLERHGKTPKFIAMCWMQGEGDGWNIYPKYYLDGLRELVGDVRGRLANRLKYEELLFVDATLHLYSNPRLFPDANIINDRKADFSKESPYNFLVSTQELGLHTELEEISGGEAHFDSDSILKLGDAFAKVAFGREK